jgi:hypothetical protein
MLRAIGRVLGWIWSGLNGLRKILHLILLLLIFGIIGTLFSRPIPLVPDKAALVIAPQGPIVEQYTGDPFQRALAQSLRRLPTQTRLRDVVDAIAAAKDDKRISALYLDLGGLTGGGLAKLQEVAATVDDFRKSGKPVIAYGDFYDQPRISSPRTPTRSISIRRASSTWTATPTTACSSRTRSTSSRWTGTSSVSASTSRPSRCSRATTCRPPSAKRASRGCRRCGARTRRRSGRRAT